MAEPKQGFGVVGLGKMGGNLAMQALEKGFSVCGLDKRKPSGELLGKGLQMADDFRAMAEKLSPSRVVFIYVPAGPIVDTVIDDLSDTLETDDIIVDGGNSYWGDSIRRAQRLEEHRIRFIDLGTSGGVSGARHGACFMAGGQEEAFKRIEPIIKALAVEDGYVHAGPSGAGHFVKLVHNGIEFGMLQAIAEGMDLLQHYHERLDIARVLTCWNHGSVIRSWLIELMEEAWREQKGMDDIPPFVEDTGEVNWLVDDAMHMEVPVPVIALSVMQLFVSRDEDKYWSRAIAMMRHGFGGHPYGPDEGIAAERQYGRIGRFHRQEE